MTRNAWHKTRDTTLAILASTLMATLITTCHWLARTHHDWHNMKHKAPQAN